MKKTDLVPVISPVSLAKLGKSKPINTETIDKICSFLHCQPGDIMEYVKEEDMPSDLSVIIARTAEDNIAKMEFIAKCNGQSLSKEIGYIIELHIAQFEKEHGKIKIPGNEVET